MTKRQADLALLEASRLMLTIIDREKNLNGSKSLIQKAQRRYDALIKLSASVILLETDVLPSKLADKVEKKTLEVTMFFFRS